jgi:hypothetical protein
MNHPFFLGLSCFFSLRKKKEVDEALELWAPDVPR